MSSLDLLLCRRNNKLIELKTADDPNANASALLNADVSEVLKAKNVQIEQKVNLKVVQNDDSNEYQPAEEGVRGSTLFATLNSQNFRE